MARSQLNINVEPNLLSELKGKARLEGKTLTSFISEILSKAIDCNDNRPLGSQLKELEEKVNTLQIQVNTINMVLDNTNKPTPFTETEAKHFSEFTKELFEGLVSKKKFKSKMEAFNQLINHVNCFSTWDQIYSLRLKEVLFIDDYDPLSSTELNDLMQGEDCPSPLRSGLITWITEKEPGGCNCNTMDFPSVQEICNKGSKLVSNII